MRADDTHTWNVTPLDGRSDAIVVVLCAADGRLANFLIAFRGVGGGLNIFVFVSRRFLVRDAGGRLGISIVGFRRLLVWRTSRRLGGFRLSDVRAAGGRPRVFFVACLWFIDRSVAGRLCIGVASRGVSERLDVDVAEKDKLPASLVLR